MHVVVKEVSLSCKGDCFISLEHLEYLLIFIGSFHIKVRKFKRDRPAELSDFIFIPHSEENLHNHSPNIETAEVIDVRNEDKKAGLVNKLKPAKKICEERILKLQIN